MRAVDKNGVIRSERLFHKQRPDYAAAARKLIDQSGFAGLQFVSASFGQNGQDHPQTRRVIVEFNHARRTVLIEVRPTKLGVRAKTILNLVSK